jgi:hypothetical protein
MTDFIIKKLPYELTSNAGLALVGQYFKRLGINQRIDPRFPISGKGIANSDILKSYLGLLVQGKNDFDAIETFRSDAFFSRSLGIGCVPSSPTLRQRMDTHSASWFDLAEELNFAVLSARYAGQAVDFGVLPCGYMPLDWDTFVMDNSGTKKEDVGRYPPRRGRLHTECDLSGLFGLLPRIGSAPWCAALGARDRAQLGTGLADGALHAGRLDHDAADGRV